MALQPCKECGNQISTAAVSCPQCGAPVSAKKQKNSFANFLLGCAGVVAVISIFSWKGEDDKSQTNSSTATSTTRYSGTETRNHVMPTALNTPAIISLPASQQGFIDIVEASRRSYNSAANDMAKGSARPTRARSLCDSMAGTTVSNWIGTISTLTTNSDGDGVLGVSIAKDVTLKTWNNSFSDISDGTILNHESAIYRKASSLSVGQKVKISGNLILERTDCFRETSLSMSGSMKDPEYLFRFSSIDPI